MRGNVIDLISLIRIIQRLSMAEILFVWLRLKEMVLLIKRC